MKPSISSYHLLFLLLLTGMGLQLHAQEQGSLEGVIRDSSGLAVELASVSLLGTSTGTMTDEKGYYSLKVPAGHSFTVVISCVGYRTTEFGVRLDKGGKRTQDITLKQDVRALREVSVSARQERASTFQHIDVAELDYMPSTGEKVETIIKSQAGVSSNNELSSTYSVRGGNFDENLIYVNDIQVYRPFLVRSGQQEGLSFINSDLVSSIKFSAGGYDARYGDRMSSALDIRYKDPKEFKGSASVSLLGASAHIEGSSKEQKFTFLAGYRYKTTTYLLNTLETTGDYKPQFSDFQSLLKWNISPKLELSFLGNYSSSKYQFVPSNRSTSFGTKDVPLNLKIYFEGQEIDQFDTYTGALSLNWKPRPGVSLKFITSAFRTSEEETFDLIGQYWINELDNTPGSDTYGDSLLNVGVGTLMNHARNYLDAIVLTAEHLGSIRQQNNHLQWGLSYQYQVFQDYISEWSFLDSAGYMLPYNGQDIEMDELIRANNQLRYDQLSAFVQNTREFQLGVSDLFVTAGLRTTLWNLNRTLMFSPRATVSYQPAWKRDMMFHLSGGYYYQPPFYKEMRRPDGSLNHNIEPQRSIHLLVGGDYIFQMWDRTFKLTAEAWYKWLDNLIPYKVENVRIVYEGDNISSGYARGIDFKLNGEFVPGAESWMTLSFLQTREDIVGDTYTYWDGEQYVTTEAGEFPRPTDQLFTFGVYFQDYFPNNPAYKVHLSGFFGSGLPLSTPVEDEYYTEYRMRAYRRVDLGFSRVIKSETDIISQRNPLRHFESIWISAEIFNLLDIQNESSYLWVRSISDQLGSQGSFAIPNYLTGRRFNLKISLRF